MEGKGAETTNVNNLLPLCVQGNNSRVKGVCLQACLARLTFLLPAVALLTTSVLGKYL